MGIQKLKLHYDRKQISLFPNFDDLEKKPNKFLREYLFRVYTTPCPENPLEISLQMKERKYLINLWEDGRKLSHYHLIKLLSLDKKQKTQEDEKRLNQALESFKEELISENCFDQNKLFQKARKISTYVGDQFSLKGTLTTSDQQKFEVDKILWASRSKTLRRTFFDPRFTKNTVGIPLKSVQLLEKLITQQDISEDISSLEEGFSFYSDILPLECPLELKNLSFHISNRFLKKDTAKEFLEFGLEHRNSDFVQLASVSINREFQESYRLRFDPECFQYQMVVKNWDKNTQEFYQEYSDYIFSISLPEDDASCNSFLENTKDISFDKIQEVCLPNLRDPQIFVQFAKLFPKMKHCCVNQFLLKSLNKKKKLQKKDLWKDLDSLRIILFNEKEKVPRYYLPQIIKDLFPSNPKVIFHHDGIDQRITKLQFAWTTTHCEIPHLGSRGNKKSSDRVRALYQQLHHHHPLLAQFAKIIEIEDPQVPLNFLHSCKNAEVIKWNCLPPDLFCEAIPSAKVLHLPLETLIMTNDSVWNYFLKNWIHLSHIVFAAEPKHTSETIQAYLSKIHNHVPEGVKKVIITNAKKSEYIPAVKNSGKYEIFLIDGDYSHSLGDSPDELLLEILLCKCTNPYTLLQNYQGKITDITFQALLDKYLSTPFLELKNGEFCDDGVIMQLEKQNHLDSLKFLNCRGLGKNAWRIIGSLKNLKKLDLRGTPISDADLWELKERLPNCEIITSQTPSSRSGQPKMVKV